MRHVAFNSRGVQSLTIRFTSNVGSTIAAADLVLTDSADNIISASVMSVSYNASKNSATWSFPGLAGGVLPAGEYQVRFLAAGISDAAGRHLDGGKDGIGGSDFVWGKVIRIST